MTNDKFDIIIIYKYEILRWGWVVFFFLGGGPYKSVIVERWCRQIPSFAVELILSADLI
jgi:hypothetical protein